tara:strand:+ start:1578 stop:1865 length:288 start_codon:yes stop_codon:yes gene_type:complete
MPVNLKRSDLQSHKYNYTWARDEGDGPYTGKLDRRRIDKDEGYEVLYFIKAMMEKYGLVTDINAKRIEDKLHSSELSKVVMRDELDKRIKDSLGF